MPRFVGASRALAQTIWLNTGGSLVEPKNCRRYLLLPDLSLKLAKDIEQLSGGTHTLRPAIRFLFEPYELHGIGFYWALCGHQDAPDLVTAATEGERFVLLTEDHLNTRVQTVAPNIARQRQIEVQLFRRIQTDPARRQLRALIWRAAAEAGNLTVRERLKGVNALDAGTAASLFAQLNMADDDLARLLEENAL